MNILWEGGDTLASLGIMVCIYSALLIDHLHTGNKIVKESGRIYRKRYHQLTANITQMHPYSSSSPLSLGTFPTTRATVL